MDLFIQPTCKLHFVHITQETLHVGVWTHVTIFLKNNKCNLSLLGLVGDLEKVNDKVCT